MGLALLRGWLAQGIPAQRVKVIDPNPAPEVVQALSDAGVARVAAADVDRADVLVLAVKPQTFRQAAAGIAGIVGEGTVVLSIMAGTTIAELRQAFPAAGSVIRAMPNLAAMAGQGASVLVAEKGSPDTAADVAEALLKAVGIVERLPDEELVDVATAVSGSGPAYVFHLVECLANAGARAGLPFGIASRLARATVQGAGAVLADNPDGPDALRRQVTSPGGTTEAALAVLMHEQGLQPLMDATVTAAAARARELGRGTR